MTTDKSKYNFIGLYADAADPRIWVPKRYALMGWTINIGHFKGRLALAMFMIGAIALMAFIATFDRH